MTWKAIRLKIVKKTSMPNCVESLEYIKYYSSSSPRPVKILSNSIRHNCQKICSWSRRPKTILEIRKMPHLSSWSTILLFKSFSNTLPTTKRRLTDLSLIFLNTGTSNDTFQQSGKTDSLRHILKSSASMYKSSGSQPFKTTTRIQSGLGAFEESRFAMMFLIILGVMEILCSFRLGVEGKTGK